jgi:uncharacterized iron-regulated protein
MTYEQLEQEVARLKALNDYNKNCYEQQYNSLVNNLEDIIRKNIGLNLEGLAEVAEHVPEKERTRILRHIECIEKRIPHMFEDYKK